ncbi:hypothetical protein [Streptomyces griseoloalbus]|uniref:Secreted protein n=1 Tax=Streptomyces griseoloalbus TaxID=67303 RepID=A0A7W8F685_9ACTN|nr:hypothetical protein [Streptomyces albaduncus]MBB5123587.1 hypothetical protein [Streptomyces albaduncus]GGW79285.1 hypothetical protein GCM10010340_67190 [Streptomyces albaduncus]
MQNLKKAAVVAGLLGGSVLLGLGTAQAHEGKTAACDGQASDSRCTQSESRYTTKDGKRVHVVVTREGCETEGSGNTVNCSVRYP